MTTAEPNPPALEGTFIGNYQVVRLVGAGAFGDVYFGKNPAIDKAVAIKVLAPEMANNAEAVARFNTEARAVDRIQHPNIVQVFDYGRLPDGRYYIVMEFLNGRSLTELIDEKAPFSLREALAILHQIASGLEAAHRNNVVHRDLKPDNVIVLEGENGEPRVKILDFGIAKMLDGALGDAARTSAGVIMGTPLYMAPEQAAGSSAEIGPATDVYALGVIAYRMISGQFPIDGENPREVLYKQVTEPPRPLAKVARGLSPKICEVVHRALEKSPRKRYQSPAVFIRDLEEAVRLLDPDLVATLVRTAEGMPPAESAADVLPEPRPAPYQPPQSSGIGFWVVLVLLVAAASGALFLIWQRARELLSARPAQEAPAAPAPISVPAPPEPPMPEVEPPMPQAREYQVTIRSRDGEANVDVFVDGQRRLEGVATPQSLKVPHGARVRVVARRSGFAEQTDEWTADANLEIELSWRRK